MHCVVKNSYIIYISLFNIHYHANRIKIKNLLDAYTTKCNILFSIICHKDKEKSKYPEAYIFSLIKDIENKCLVIGFNFISLYFNLIMAYNLSSEKLILSYKEANNICEKENKLYEIKFPFNDHIFNAWSVRYGNYSEKKGLYLTVLEDLFNK